MDIFYCISRSLEKVLSDNEIYMNIIRPAPSGRQKELVRESVQ